MLSQLSYAPNLLKVEPSKLNINLSRLLKQPKRMCVDLSYVKLALHMYSIERR